MKNDESSVFISYAHEDCDIAERLYNDLKDEGVKPWMSKFDLVPGQNWKHEIDRAIKECAYFIALLSENSISKEGFVQKELKLALERLDKLPLSRIFCIQVRIEECVPLDERFQHIQWVDLFPDYQKGFKEILRAFKDINEKREKISDEKSKADSDFRFDKSGENHGVDGFNRYTIASQEDVSHAGAKRYSVNVILNGRYSKDIIREIVRTVTGEMKRSRYYRNEQTKTRWGETPAHVVWLFLGQDLNDIIRANWICKSCWIDPILPEKMRPSELKGNDSIGGIQIEWNDQYDDMKKVLISHQADKGEYFETVGPVTDQMIALGGKAAQLYSQYEQKTITEDQLIAKMQSLKGEADSLYDLSSNFPFALPECKDYNQSIQNLFATVHDMFLYYSERGLETWKKSNREWLMRKSIKACSGNPDTKNNA